MKNKKKAGLLILILAVPAFVVLIGQFFKADHKFTLPHFGDNPVDEVHLKTITGDSIVLSIGKTLSIVTFLCKEEEEVANRVMSEMTRLQELYAGSGSIVKLYTIFSCQEQETYLHELTKLYDVQPEFWILTTPNQSIQDIANNFGVELNKESENYSEQAYSSVYLLDKELMIRGFYNGYSNDDVNKLMEDIRVLEHEYK